MGQHQVARNSQTKFPGEISKEELKERLKRGYSQMAELNLKLAKEGLLAEKEAYQQV